MDTSKVTWTNNSPSEQGGDLKGILFLGGAWRGNVRSVFISKKLGRVFNVEVCRLSCFGLKYLDICRQEGCKGEMGGVSEKLLKRCHRCFGDFFLIFFWEGCFFSILSTALMITLETPWIGHHDFASRWRWTWLERGAVGVFWWEWWVDLGRFSVAQKSRCCRFSFMSSTCGVLERCINSTTWSGFHDLKEVGIPPNELRGFCWNQFLVFREILFEFQIKMVN